jgi:hypothetical protein
MKLIDVDSKPTLENFPRKCNEKISGRKNELVLRASKGNQVIYGVNSFVDDDAKYEKDYVEDREVPLMSELNTGWSGKENIFPQISHKYVETYLVKCRSHDNENMSCYRQFIRGLNFYEDNYIHDISFF